MTSIDSLRLVLSNVCTLENFQRRTLQCGPWMLTSRASCDDSSNLFTTRHELCFHGLFSSAQKCVRYCHQHIESDSISFSHPIVMNPITFSPTPGYFFTASHNSSIRLISAVYLIGRVIHIPFFLSRRQLSLMIDTRLKKKIMIFKQVCSAHRSGFQGVIDTWCLQ